MRRAFCADAFITFLGVDSVERRQSSLPVVLVPLVESIDCLIASTTIPTMSLTDSLSQCSDGCGWVAGLVAALAYGSFGVPVRHTKHIPVHPLVLQTFKSCTLFVLAWSVLLLDVTPSWTWWGLVSGLLWVLGGTGGIYAIRMAGLAIAVGTWASVMIAVNFWWGILVFHEPIHDLGGTAAAFVLLSAGLVGMSIFAAPASKPPAVVLEMEDDSAASSVPPTDEEESSRYQNMDDSSGPTALLAPTGTTASHEDDGQKIAFSWRGRSFTQREAGIAGAVANGLLTGSSLIPLHYAKARGFGGAHFMLSMAGGALLSNAALWVLFYLYRCYTVGSANNDDNDVSLEEPSYASSQSLWRRAYDAMPLWHFGELVGPGIAAGTLLAIAMFGSILSVTYLGQGVGNSIVQAKIVISGLWGILWFGEISGRRRIVLWFGAASLTIGGILGLSYERILAQHEDGGGGHS
jgi:glucose uptake protein GlcU